ncbi:MAG: F0F1 ATP synthase subunit delta [Patescibacteria group bacterium]
MKSEYTHALLQLLEEGLPIEKALAGLRTTLARRHHGKLFVPILREVVRVLEAKKGVRQAVVATASTATQKALAEKIKSALTALGASTDTPVENVVDETLIGGFVATFNHEEYDYSYRKALKSLYESITR